MKISELIAALGEVRAREGDLDVRVYARHRPNSVTAIDRLQVLGRVRRGRAGKNEVVVLNPLTVLSAHPKP